MLANVAEFDGYRGPNTAVDVAVFTVVDGGLAVLVQNRTEKPRGKVLPGRFLREGETVGVGLRATLRDKVGPDVGPIDPARANLVRVFDKPKRDPRSSWSLSLAHYLVLPLDRLAGAAGDFVAVDEDGSVDARLLFDHDAIVREAASDLRTRYEAEPDPENLCGDDEVTLPDLQRVHEAVLGAPLRTDTFRRRMEDMLERVPDPTDPQGRRTKTRPSGPSGGPPTRLWTRRVVGDVGAASRLFRLPRAD
jgi:8-oxo-dGTP diphosphatase